MDAVAGGPGARSGRDGARRGRRRRGWRRRLRGAGVLDARRADRAARERRATRSGAGRRPFFARLAAAWRRATRGGGSCSVPGRRIARRRLRIAADARGNGSAATAGRIVDLGEFDLQELRALIGRSRLFVGGDTGPLHIAAATAHADRRHLRPDALGAVGAVAAATDRRRCRSRRRGTALPAVRSAGLRAG